jgi:hypothetical protein
MKLLVDTDAFCKLAICGLLEDAVHLLGASFSECGRLVALPHMLRGGRLRKKYGDEDCELILRVAESILPISEADVVWLDKLAQIEAIDPGEAQLFAAAAQSGAMVMTGDKRALMALKNIAEFPASLEGRVVALEAVLIALCNHIGSDDIRHRLQPCLEKDQMFKICFSAFGSEPLECLRSYYHDLVAGVAPLVLWDPWPRNLK